MRGGQLLAESSPTELLARFQTDSLEEAFLTLSQQQSQNPHSSFERPTIQPAEEIHEVMTFSGNSSEVTRIFSFIQK